MAQPNVVREPSMDEILASIRRIIESNDPVPGVSAGMPEPEGFSGSAANDDLEDVPLTIDEAFAPMMDSRPPPPKAVFEQPLAREERIDPMSDARLRLAPQPEVAAAHHTAAPREPEPAAQPKSLSLADVAARVRAASERNPGLRDLAPKPAEDEIAATVAAPSEPASSPLMTSRMMAAGGGVPERPVKSPAEHDGEPLPLDWNDLVARTERRPPIQQSSVAARAAVDTVVAQPAVPDAVASEALAATSLISMDAGQQVARSFQDLAVAVDQAERRSYDDIAADLLRPMLQEWLDENLPTLVERLVREEIERVARGNRR